MNPQNSPQDSTPGGGYPRRRLVILALSVLVVLLLAVTSVLLLRPEPQQGAQGETSSGIVRVAGNADIGGPFTLIDHDGRPVTEASFPGKHLLIYFGFTYCPDVCPTELQIMANAIDALGPAGDAVQPLLISIDPERDTPQQLKEYVAAFHPRMIGLTGSEEQIAAAAKAYRVYYAKTTPAPDGSYNVDHTSYIYLMGPDGKLQALFRAGAEPEAMAKEIRARVGAG